jgi:hypothetical protein
MSREGTASVAIKLLPWWLLALPLALTFGALLVFGALMGAQLKQAGVGDPFAVGPVGDIPPAYVALYRQAAFDNGIDWTILAGIGSVETDHGRSTAPGVKSGVNSFGCCAGPMQFSLVGNPSTWDQYGAHGNVYDPADAIPAAARYLVASGAPHDYHSAILAYNHSEAYYQEVMAKAREYKREAAAITDSPAGAGTSMPLDGEWLMTVPGTAFQCDRRIIADVVALTARFHMQLSACYAATGHEPNGEHPLGLATDLVPKPPASWGAAAALARFAGWRPECASTGCADQTHTVFRFVGWNGYPGHGDPEHAGAGAHLHLSWSHGSGKPAAWVRVLYG